MKCTLALLLLAIPVAVLGGQSMGLGKLQEMFAWNQMTYIARDNPHHGHYLPYPVRVPVARPLPLPIGLPPSHPYQHHSHVPPPPLPHHMGPSVPWASMRDTYKGHSSDLIRQIRSPFDGPYNPYEGVQPVKTYDDLPYEEITYGEISVAPLPLPPPPSPLPPPMSYKGILGEDDPFYIKYNNVPFGIEPWNDKIFVMVPRRRQGIPSTLNYISLHKDGSVRDPALRPYPDYQTNDLRVDGAADPTKLVSVYRTAIDACDRLWMVDTGKIERPATVIQSPSIVIFDLKTDRMIRRFNLMDSHLLPFSNFPSIAVDLDLKRGDTCNDAFAYIPDLGSYGLIVYSFKDNMSWRVDHDYFYLNPLAGDYDVNGLRFQWNDGVFGTVLTPTQKDGYSVLIFQSLCGTHDFAVSTRVLKNQTLATRSYHEDDFMVLGDRGPGTQTTAMSIDPHSGVVFYPQVGRNALACWNIQKPYSASNQEVLAQDDELLEYPTDTKVDRDGNLWVLANKAAEFAYSSLDPNSDNFYIYKANVKDLIAGTVCSVHRY